MASFIGKSIGDYVVNRFIGQGGYATVYQCEHLPTKTGRAIKIVEKPLSAEQEMLFLNEIDLHSQMRHSAIIPFRDSGETSDCRYLVIDYASFGTLERLSGQQVELSIIVPFINQLATALDYMHQQYIVHCDVKPSNFLLVQNDTVSLGDFGIATNTARPIKGLYGTIEYVSPERWKRQPCPASDQYSLAITVYQWLSGECPFDNQKAILLNPPPSLCNQLPGLSQEIEDIVFKALVKEPQYRYDSVSAFATALEQAYKRTMPVATIPTPQASTASAVKMTRKIGHPIIVPPTPIIGTRQLYPLLPRGKERSVYVYQAHKAEVVSLIWSPDGTQLASADLKNNVHIWNALDGSNTHIHRGFSHMILNMAWSPDGLCIASADEVQAVQFWDVMTRQKLFRYQHRTGPLDEVGIGLYYPMAWSRDGFYMISASDNQPLEKWDTTTGNRLFDYQHHTDTIKAIAWSPDQRLIASGGSDTTVHVWDADTGQTQYIYSRHRGYIHALSWSPNSQRVASAGTDGIVYVWNALDGSNILAYTVHRPREIKSLMWSPDGSKIASADDKRVRIWNAITGETLTSLEEHTDKINVVTWSPTGEHLASASDDGTVRMWKIEV